MWEGPNGTEAEEHVKGSFPYLSCLELLHKVLRPKRYLEIGVRDGTSLVLAECDAVGVDPEPVINRALSPRAKVLKLTSDEFFEGHETATEAPFDMVFIDGMHHFEFVLRDFANAEKTCGPNSIIVIDDIYPNHPKQALRDRQTGTWTGDVWKVTPILRKWRPELRIFELDTFPTGLLLVAGLDPSSDVIDKNVDAIVAEAERSEAPPREVLERTASMKPTADEISKALAPELSVVGGQPPKLSIVIIAQTEEYGISRLVRSLSESIQRGIAKDDYEIIVVWARGHSALELGKSALTIPNMLASAEASQSRSLQNSVELGLGLARGDLIGIFLDPSTIASPGLLAAVLAANASNPHATIGVQSFKVTPKIGIKNLLEGYGPSIEEKTLKAIGWEQDGYRLFDHATFAGSSKRDWFSLPSNPRALFLKAGAAKSVQFASQEDLGAWSRFCQAPGSEVVVIVGEGTFNWIASKNGDASLKVANEPNCNVNYIGKPRQVSNPNLRYHFRLISLRAWLASWLARLKRRQTAPTS